ncbi:hypothetical protein QBC43DRAFT_286137 [Cladorrhinum sp. PSN259]|nr:hypothetical protein QBC43DRAFT_286137 [Cladorrhinum sp. PSN259]
MSTHEERMKKIHDEIDEINRRIEQISSSRTGFSSSYSALQDLGVKPSYSSFYGSSSFSSTSGSGGYGSTNTSSDSWRSTLLKSDTRDSLEEEVRRKEAASRAATERWKAIRDANSSASGYSGGGSSSSSSTTGLGGGYSSTTTTSTYRPSSPLGDYFSKDKGTATGASYTSAFGTGTGAGGDTSSSFDASDWKNDTGGYSASTSKFDFSKGATMTTTTTTTTSDYGGGISSGSGTSKSLYEPTTTASYAGGSTAVAAGNTSPVARASRPSLPPLIMPPSSPSPSSPIGSHWSPNLPSPD